MNEPTHFILPDFDTLKNCGIERNVAHKFAGKEVEAINVYEDEHNCIEFGFKDEVGRIWFCNTDCGAKVSKSKPIEHHD